MAAEYSLSLWFGLSYGSFAVLPRVLMEAMPERWQADMARLLNEADDAFPGAMGGLTGYRVQGVRDGKLVPIPRWLLSYRHPDPADIERARHDFFEKGIDEG